MGWGAVMGIGVGTGLLAWGMLLPDAVASAMNVVESTSAVASEVNTDEITEFTGVAEEIPEEILRTEIITEARSPLTGEPLTATEYAQLEAQLAEPAGSNLVSEDLRYLIFLLQLRRAVKPILPFIR